MHIKSLLFFLILSLVSLATLGQTYSKTIDDLDYDRKIENSLMTFIPFEWSETSGVINGVVWYKKYLYKLTLGSVNATTGLRTATIVLKAVAIEPNSTAYNAFISQNGIRDEKIRLFNNFKCEATPEFNDFVTRVSGRSPVIRLVGDAANLCQISFTYDDSWTTQINEKVNAGAIFNVVAGIPGCSNESPVVDVKPIVDNLIASKAVNDVVAGAYKGKLYPALYEIVKLSQDQPSLFKDQPKATMAKLLPLFSLNQVTKEISISLENSLKSLTICMPEDTPIVIEGLDQGGAQ